jgi:hypothetical protein
MIRPSVPLFRASKERSSLAVDKPGEAEVRCVIFLGTGDSFNGERAQASGRWSNAIVGSNPTLSASLFYRFV